MKRRDRTPAETERNAALCAAYRRGDPVDAIADEYGVSRARVCQIAKRAGLRRQKRDGPGASRIEAETV
jgi:transposase